MLQFLAPAALIGGAYLLVKAVSGAVADLAENHYYETQIKYEKTRRHHQEFIQRHVNNAQRYKKMQELKVLRDEAALVADAAWEEYMKVLKSINSLWNIEQEISVKIDKIKQQLKCKMKDEEYIAVENALFALIESSKQSYQKRQTLLEEKTIIRKHVDELNAIKKSYVSQIKNLAEEME